MRTEETRFEWDERKNRINRRKHGIRFEEAARVFLDENKIERYDTHHSNPFEDRYVIIGMMENGKIIMMVCVFKTDSIRIISARKANRREIREYHEKNDYV